MFHGTVDFYDFELNLQVWKAKWLYSIAIKLMNSTHYDRSNSLTFQKGVNSKIIYIFMTKLIVYVHWQFEKFSDNYTYNILKKKFIYI